MVKKFTEMIIMPVYVKSPLQNAIKTAIKDAFNRSAEMYRRYEENNAS